MLTAREALAIASLLTPEEFSLHKHLEVRIWDSIRIGGKHIIYAGEFPDNVARAFLALGYTITYLEHEDKQLVQISWDKAK